VLRIIIDYELYENSIDSCLRRNDTLLLCVFALKKI